MCIVQTNEKDYVKEIRRRLVAGGRVCVQPWLAK